MRFPSRSFGRGLVTLATLLGILVAPGGANGAEPTRVPFSLSPRGHILVPVILADGESRQFILDTAAGSCVIGPDLAQKLGNEPLEEREAVVGEHGHSEHDVLILDGVTLGDRSRDGLRTVVQDLGPVSRGGFSFDGILGAQFLRQFDVRIDFEKKIVTLFDPATTENCPICPGESVPIPIDLHDQGHILLPAGIGDVDLTGVLDTGSGHSGINSLAADALGVELPDLPPSGHGFGILTGPIRVGAQVILEQGPLAVMDRADIFAAFGLADKPRILMGTDLFAGRVLSISYSSHRLFVE